MKPGPRNLITDIPGLKVGHGQDAALKSGCTALLGGAPFTAGVSVMGGAPGTRDTELLAPDKTVPAVDALVLSGGSAFGLDTASGVTEALRAMGRGFAVGPHKIPIVPAAILFDLSNGGDKDWTMNPYAALGRAAVRAASTQFSLGSHGAGIGATTAGLKGGLGSASLVLPSGHTVGALVAVNPLGNVTVGDGAHFWASPFEMASEFGNLGPAPAFDATQVPPTKLTLGSATTIAIIATDAALDKAGCTRMATAAQDGFARAIYPSHTPMDGDLIFAAATNDRPLADPVMDSLALGNAAAICVARAIARGVYEATPAPGDPLPTWREAFGR